MTETKKEPTYQPISFDAIKIGLASPEKILEWSTPLNLLQNMRPENQRLADAFF